jgi:hypothetical protein
MPEISKGRSQTQRKTTGPSGYWLFAMGWRRIQKKSKVDTYLKCDKPENVAINDLKPVTGVTLENCCR